MGRGRGTQRGQHSKATRTITDFFGRASSLDESQERRRSSSQEPGKCVREASRGAGQVAVKAGEDLALDEQVSRSGCPFQYSQVPGGEMKKVPPLAPPQQLPPRLNDEILATPPAPRKRKVGMGTREMFRRVEGSTERVNHAPVLPPEISTPEPLGWSPWTPRQGPGVIVENGSSDKRRKTAPPRKNLSKKPGGICQGCKDKNISSLTPQVLDEIPQEVVHGKENSMSCQTFTTAPQRQPAGAPSGNEVGEESRTSTALKIRDDLSSDDDQFLASIPEELLQHVEQPSCHENVSCRTVVPANILRDQTSTLHSVVNQAPVATGNSALMTSQEGTSGPNRDAAVRFAVENIVEDARVKRVTARHRQRMYTVEVELRGAWMHTNVGIGDSVNLMGDVFREGIHQRLIIDDYNGGLFVVKPDFLLSSTCIAGAVGQQCKRKAIIEDWMQRPSQGNKQMILGTMLHSLIQAGLLQKMQTNVNRADVVKMMKQVVDEHVDGLIEADIQEKDALAGMEERIPALLRWLNTYVGPSAKREAVLKSSPPSEASSEPICISGLVDIEDVCGGCKYGLKGRVDATVRIQRGRHGSGDQSKGRDAKVAPLEFKTGRPHFSHEAQVALYNLMLEDSCGSGGQESGLLWYLGKPDSDEQNRKMTQIHTVPSHTAALMQARNTLVSSLSSVPVALPDMLKDATTCDRCFAQAACGVLHKAREAGTPSTSGFGHGKFQELTDHVTPSCSKFLVDWLNMVDLEEEEARTSDGVSSVFRKLRGNVMALIADPLHERLRDLILHESPPHQPAECANLDIAQLTKQLNQDQEDAVKAIMSSTELCIVWGMPGAGKTLTTALAIKGLVEQGQSVLVTAYTNNAVDNLLLRLDDLGVLFLRVGGRKENVHPGIVKHMFGGEVFPDVSLQGKKNTLRSIKVIGTTCLSAAHPTIAARTFDVCIVDEAGQVSIPAILGPLMKAKRFVLVGDFKQLPPVVRSRQAAQQGMAETLFEKWASAHPEMVMPLRVQYRMAGDIMSLANTLVYDGSMRCGVENVRKRRLRYRAEDSSCINQYPPWIRESLDPESRVRFLDTDSVVLEKSGSEAGGRNALEGKVAQKLVDALLQLGLPSEDIGVISPYRNQVSLLGPLLASKQDVEVSTVDKFQGREKECIIVSFVKSNDEKCAGILLEDVRRLNVAITRAKAKLLLIGSSSTLASVPFLKSLIEFCSSKRWMLEISNEQAWCTK